MTERPHSHILPYSLIVGQEDLKLALELSYIAPRIGGVLISGQPGTGKSTAARAFAQMAYERLPVTIPINATEDRVVGGWRIDELMRSRAVPQAGLLEEANGGMLFIDEVNLLDDHTANIILDVSSTGVLVVQREGRREQKEVVFTLVGTMNPKEGWLRPQLLDRFGLMVSVTAESEEKERGRILQTVLMFDEALFYQTRNGQDEPFVQEAREKDRERRAELQRAQQNLYHVKIPESVAKDCVTLAEKFEAQGHRADYVIALAARAYAALQGTETVTNEHVGRVARMALQHRRSRGEQDSVEMWHSQDNTLLQQCLNLTSI